MENHFDFTVNSNNHKVFLNPATLESKNSVLIGGIKYSIGGEERSVTLFKNIVNQFDQIQDFGDLKERFSKIASNPEVGRTKLLGNDIIMHSNKQTAIENAIVPTYPIPGASKISLLERMEEMGVKGVSITVIDGGKDVLSAGYGELKEPGVLIQGASISKTVTALIIMSLIDQNLLTLNTNIKDILPPKLWDSISGGAKEITIKQLLSHSAGLPEESSDGFPGYFRKELILKELEELKLKEKTPALEERIQELEDLLQDKLTKTKEELPNLDQILEGVKVTETPGEHFAYNGGGAMILQKVIEDLTKQPFDKVADELVFDQLGMKNSFFKLEENAKTASGNGSGGLPGGWVMQPELAAAGLWTTSEDLAKLLIGIQQALKGNGIISQGSAQDMITPVIESHGLGLFLDEQKDAAYFCHSGSNKGFQCLMVANDHGQGAVIMTNSDFGKHLYPEIVRKIAEEYGWKGKTPSGNGIFPPLHPEVIEGAKFNLEEWKKAYEGDYENIERPEFKFHLTPAEDGKFYLYYPEKAKKEPVEVLPISKNLGVLQEDKPGPWIPIEFSNQEGVIQFSLHDMAHKKAPAEDKLPQENLIT